VASHGGLRLAAKPALATISGWNQAKTTPTGAAELQRKRPPDPLEFLEASKLDEGSREERQ